MAHGMDLQTRHSDCNSILRYLVEVDFGIDDMQICFFGVRGCLAIVLGDDNNMQIGLQVCRGGCRVY